MAENEENKSGDENTNGNKGGNINEEQAKNLLIEEEKNETANAEVKPPAQKEKGLGEVETPEAKYAREQAEYRKDAERIGFRELDFANVPSKGMFYESGRKHMFRSANLEEIKHYSSMDEADLMDIDAHVNEIIDRCTKITLGNNRGIGSYKDISEFDKIHMIFSIRDLSMLKHKRERKLMQEVKCKHCPTTNKVEINNQLFGYYDIPKGIMRWYSSTERCFVINDPAIETPLKIYIPTVGVLEYMAAYVKKKEIEKQRNEGGYYDKQFLTFAQFLIPDWRDLDEEGKFLKELEHRVKNVWNYDKHSLMVNLVEKLTYGIKPNIEFNCEECKGRLQTLVRFRSYKSLFDLSDVADRLLSDTE
jgi:hypothetical protein